MKSKFAAGLIGLTIALGSMAAAPAFAQAALVGASVDTTPIADLAANPATKAVLDKHVPPLTTHPAFEQFKGMTLKALEPMSQGAITDEIIAAIQADFDKIK